MEIRRLTIGHLEPLLSFYSTLPKWITDFFEPFGPVVAEQILSKHLTDADSGVNLSLGLFDDSGVILGHVFIWNTRSELPVFGIGLAESAQGQGWGRRMAERVIEEAGALGAKRITLTVVKANSRAWTLYERLGFRRTGEVTFRTEKDSYSMERG
jgi:RimJ/RimL family protein N-acetyltransferase